MKLFATTLFAGAVLAASSAFAATTVYNNVTDFNAALPGGTSTLETFDAEATGILTAGVERAFGGFALSFENIRGNQGVGILTPTQVNTANGTAIGTTNQLAWGERVGFSGTGDGPDVTFRFFAPITAFAFDFSDSDTTDSYSVTIGNEAPFQLASGTSSTFQSFFGLVSDTAFTTVVFKQTATGGFTEAFSIDNIRTNGFNTQEEANAVPVPASLPLLLAGFGGLAWLRRRKSA